MYKHYGMFLVVNAPKRNTISITTMVERSRVYGLYKADCLFIERLGLELQLDNLTTMVESPRMHGLGQADSLFIVGLGLELQLESLTTMVESPRLHGLGKADGLFIVGLGLELHFEDLTTMVEGSRVHGLGQADGLFIVGLGLELHLEDLIEHSSQPRCGNGLQLHVQVTCQEDGTFEPINDAPYHVHVESFHVMQNFF